MKTLDYRPFKRTPHVIAGGFGPVTIAILHGMAGNRFRILIWWTRGWHQPLCIPPFPRTAKEVL